VFYRPTYAFPGWYVLAPTLAAMVLIATPHSLVNRTLLSSSPLVFIGKISYSWYLWHWPLFFLNRILAPTGEGLAPVILLLASFVLAVASWRFVEQPFRRRKLTQKVVLLRYGALAALISVPAVAFFLTDGWPTRFSPAVQALSETTRVARADPCLARYGVTTPRGDSACLPAASGPRFVVLGDSHASAISPGFKALADRQGLGFGQITKTSCPPLWGYAREVPGRPGHRAECLAFQEQAFAYVQSHPDIDVVVLASYWSSGPILTSATGADAPLADALSKTVERLEAMGRRVVLVEDVPTFRFDPYPRVIGAMIPARAALSRALFPQQPTDFTASPGDIHQDPSVAILRATSRAPPGVALLDPRLGLCGASGCRYGAPDTLYYFDFQHLTSAGARAAIGDFRIDHAASASSPPSQGAGQVTSTSKPGG
jgi:hypothetical protein